MTDMDKLINSEVVRRYLSQVAYAESHGAFASFLGSGIFYFAISHILRSQVSVCIGSGGGFVPVLMRMAQIESKITPSKTYLVDATLGELGFGGPDQKGGWLTE